MTSWLTCHPDRLTGDQAQQLKAILARCPLLDRTAHHVRAFAELMNGRQGRHLDQWITQVQAEDLPALHTFVTGLGQDLDAAPVRMITDWPAHEGRASCIARRCRLKQAPRRPMCHSLPRPSRRYPTRVCRGAIASLTGSVTPPTMKAASAATPAI
ncbi:hypothetical protein [Streptomyces sp. NPDC054794]